MPSKDSKGQELRVGDHVHAAVAVGDVEEGMMGTIVDLPTPDGVRVLWDGRTSESLALSRNLLKIPGGMKAQEPIRPAPKMNAGYGWWERDEVVTTYRGDDVSSGIRPAPRMAAGYGGWEPTEIPEGSY